MKSATTFQIQIGAGKKGSYRTIETIDSNIIYAMKVYSIIKLLPGQKKRLTVLNRILVKHSKE
jgi:hypothetical protein